MAEPPANSRSRGRRSPLESAPINITPREKRRAPGTAGRPVTSLRAVPRAIAPPMASNVRSEEYAQLKAEFDTMQVEMDALGIGASSKKLEEFEDWRRHREQRNERTLWAMLAGTTRAQSIVPRRQRQRPPLPRREARVPMPGPRCAATRTPLLHCSRDSRPVRLRSVPGQRRRSPVCGESRARLSARSWPPSGKCCPGLK